MHLERLPSAHGALSSAEARLVRALAALLLLTASGWARGQEGPPPAAAETAAEADAKADSAREPDARVDGSLSLRAGLREGAGNDRLSARLSLEWSAGHWSGGFTAEFENAMREGAIHQEDGVGSFDLSERWVGWSRELARSTVDLRLGTTFGLRFGEGLVLGSASFDGLAARVTAGRRWELAAVAGRTDVLDPYDFFEEPLDLLPEEEEFLGTKGELVGLRVQAEAAEGLVIGLNGLRARADGTPWAGLASVDLALRRGALDLAAELAAREQGGTAAYLRGDWSPSDKWGLGFEHRNYRDFVSPVGHPPLYTGLSAGSERDETGWLVRLDLLPTERFSASLAFDYSSGGGKDSPGVPTVRRAHSLELNWLVSERTSISYGFELEDLAGGRDGTIHSILATHAFEDGGRLSARLQVDHSSADARESLRMNYRRPFFGRRLTLLVDDTLRRQEGGVLNTLQLGASLRLGLQSHLTVRGTLADDEANGLDLTWYRRF